MLNFSFNKHLVVLDQIYHKKGYFLSKKKKWTHHGILHIQISLRTNFRLKLTIFRTKSGHHHWILHIWINLGTKVQLKLTILIVKFTQKEYFPSTTEKMNAIIIFYILKINLGTKFQLNLTILIFWIKFTQNEYFWSKMEKLNSSILNSGYSN